MRKKFTMLLASLFLVLGSAWAQVTSLKDFKQDKCYTFSTPSRGGWAVKTDGSQFASTYDCGWGTTVDPTNESQLFAVLSANGEDYYLYSVSAKKFIKADRTLVEIGGDALAMTAATGNYKGRARFKFRDIQDSYINLGGDKQMTVDWWGTIDDGNAVLVSEAGDFDATEALAKLAATVNITYKYYVDETLITETTVEINKGANYPAANAVPGYVATTGVPTGQANETGTFDIQCSLATNFPFSSTTYFGLTFRNGAKWLIGTEEGQKLTTKGLSIFNADEANSYSWIVEGTWYTGFYFKNKETGKYLAAPETMEHGAETILVDEKSESAKFSIDLRNSKYYIRQFDVENNCVSDLNGGTNASLRFWNSSYNYGDPGSQVVVVSTEPQDLLNAFKHDYSASVGCVGGYDVDAEDINNLTLETVAKFLAENEITALTAGYYYIKATGVGNDAAWYVSNDNGNFKAVALGEHEGVNKKYMWSLETTEGENGYKLKSVASNNYANALNNASSTNETTPVASDFDSGAKFTFTNYGAGKFIIKDGNNQVLRTEGDGRINYWSGESNESWYLVPLTDEEMSLCGFVAKVGTEYHATLQAAITAAEAEETIELINDITLDQAIDINKVVTLNRNGKTITRTGEGYAFEVTGELILEGEGSINGGIHYTINDNDYKQAGKAYAMSADKVGVDISYNRTFGHNNWQVLYVPFAIPIESMSKFDVYAITNASNEAVVVAQVTESELSAHIPYLIKAKSTGEQTISVKNGTLKAAPENDYSQVIGGGYTFTGTYAAKPITAETEYVLTGGEWCQLNNSSQVLGAFRVYLTVDGSAAPVLRIMTRGEEDTTAIDSAVLNVQPSSVIYDLLGRRVEKMDKGIYIVNGRKVVVK